MSPLPTNPKEIWKVSLESDEKLPKSKRPTFHYRYLSGMEQMELADTMDQLADAPSGKAAFERVFAAAATKLVKWTNIVDEKGKAIAFDGKNLSQVIGLTEANELIQKLLGQSPTVNDKKKSVSASGLDSLRSKAAADAKGQGNAKTSQTK